MEMVKTLSRIQNDCWKGTLVNPETGKEIFCTYGHKRVTVEDALEEFLTGTLDKTSDKKFLKEMKEIFAKHEAKIEHGKKLVAEGKLGKGKGK